MKLVGAREKSVVAPEGNSPEEEEKESVCLPETSCSFEVLMHWCNSLVYNPILHTRLCGVCHDL